MPRSAPDVAGELRLSVPHGRVPVGTFSDPLGAHGHGGRAHLSACGVEEVQRVGRHQKIVLPKDHELSQLLVEHVVEKLPRVPQHAVFHRVDVTDHRHRAESLEHVDNLKYFSELLARLNEELNAGDEVQIRVPPRVQAALEEVHPVVCGEGQHDLVVVQPVEHRFPVGVALLGVAHTGDFVFRAVPLRRVGVEEPEIDGASFRRVNVAPRPRHSGEPVVAIDRFEGWVPDVTNGVVEPA